MKEALLLSKVVNTPGAYYICENWKGNYMLYFRMCMRIKTYIFIAGMWFSVTSRMSCFFDRFIFNSSSYRIICPLSSLIIIIIIIIITPPFCNQ
jgi:hypothetical protein